MSSPGPDAPAPFDEAALERLYARLQRRVYNVVFRWVWNAEEAAEIVQESFVRLWDKRSSVDLATVEALLYRIAVNRAKNRRRWLRLRTFVGGEVLDSLTGGHDQEVGLLRSERERSLKVAIESLPEAQKQIVLLCHYAEMSYREVAEVVGIPEGTVGSRRNTALASLRAALGEAGHVGL